MSKNIIEVRHEVLIFISYSILFEILLNEIIDCMIIEGSYNVELFTSFIKGLLNHCQQFSSARFVIVMNNCSIHKSPQIRELIEFR